MTREAPSAHCRAFCRRMSVFKKLVAYTVSEILLRFRRGSGPIQWGVGVTIFHLWPAAFMERRTDQPRAIPLPSTIKHPLTISSGITNAPRIFRLTTKRRDRLHPAFKTLCSCHWCKCHDRANTIIRATIFILTHPPHSSRTVGRRQEQMTQLAGALQCTSARALASTWFCFC
jgi:hypothetical protein